MSKVTKETITKVVFDNLPSTHPFQNLTTHQLMFLWWTTGRSSSGLRLSEEGRDAFELAEIEYYEYPVYLTKDQQKDFSIKKFTLDLGKKINCPYYIGLKNKKKNSAYIRVYDSKVAMLISLYGNLIDFLYTNNA